MPKEPISRSNPLSSGKCPLKEGICNEEDSWICVVGIRNSASNRARHARSSRCPRKLFASLHGSCRVRQLFRQQLGGESALCPSCGAPHRSPDSPPPLLNREYDGRQAWQGTKPVSNLSTGCRRGPAVPPKAFRLGFIDDALWRATGTHPDFFAQPSFVITRKLCYALKHRTI